MLIYKKNIDYKVLDKESLLQLKKKLYVVSSE